ncbi:NUDIX domain-containing protein [Desulfosporosinus sp. PR]|uniref:NUDIX domain-containing protein n=1 Tax=Candidatus Desulfosporosinus nitrosoreducens TaxID=3401928 RepID=UPI0027EBCFEB|nr:NUDIX domain-containing protein [Desulfosporosinus sp. PR]MDQ7092635.1 NUDIX domain-containing protein [Desulfosporosinus sp. PR]
MRQIRNSAKAIIIKDNKILLTKNQDSLGIFYLLPGGGQEAGESIVDALKRECLEEISVEVDVLDIRYVRDYIGKNHEFSVEDSEIHQIEYMFICSVNTGFEARNGIVPDTMQIGVEWVELKSLGKYRLYPKILKSLILEDGLLEGRIYLGDIS